MVKKLLQLLPDPVKNLAGVTRKFILYYGTSRKCPVCGKGSRKFLRAGIITREDALCPFCGALERHRLVWLFFKRKTNIFDGKEKKVLHVAPEKCFLPRLRKILGSDYITADILPGADIIMDIMNIQYPDEYFDIVYCSHVLEHVQDDRQAMREFYRVLKKDGWAILLVPITAEKTFEDPSIIDPAERLRVFGQEDHVRRYGPDFADRLLQSGFKVTVSNVADVADKRDIERMGLTDASGQIFYCTKK